MATKKTSIIDITNMNAVIDRKEAIAVKFSGYINGLSFEGVGYFEHQLYNTIDLFSIQNIKQADQRNIKVLVKRMCSNRVDADNIKFRHIKESAIVYHSATYSELDQKHNGYVIALKVPSSEQEEVLGLGGIYNPITKKWVVTSKNPNLKRFNKWLVGAVY